MKCRDCGARMRGNGSRERRGEVLRHRTCRCGARAVTLEKTLVWQKAKNAPPVQRSDDSAV